MEKESFNYFKQCSLCGTTWETAEDFLNDPSLQLNGYQFSAYAHRFGNGNGLLLFTHKKGNCNTTLAIFARDFKENDFPRNKPHLEDLVKG
ncbi:MAG: hypothetical protein H3C35_07630 [Bacteroidetes bacterium]|nr:hypothetical protein [Bacteroidota bacterium]